MRWIATALLGTALGCDASSVYYLYYANAYEPALGCLDTTAPLDVFSGSDPGSTCDPKCLAGVDSDGSVIVYTSTMCGPPPVAADTSGTNPLCPAALAARGRGDFCLDGGGSTSPLDGGID